MTFNRFLIPAFAVYNLQVLVIVNFLGFSFGIDADKKIHATFFLISYIKSFSTVRNA